MRSCETISEECIRMVLAAILHTPKAGISHRRVTVSSMVDDRVFGTEGKLATLDPGIVDEGVKNSWRGMVNTSKFDQLHSLPTAASLSYTPLSSPLHPPSRSGGSWIPTWNYEFDIKFTESDRNREQWTGWGGRC